MAGPIFFCILFGVFLMLVGCGECRPINATAWPLSYDLNTGAYLMAASCMLTYSYPHTTQSGKVHFGYIYGVAMLGCFAMYAVLNLMSDTGIDVTRTARYVICMSFSCHTVQRDFFTQTLNNDPQRPWLLTPTHGSTLDRFDTAETDGRLWDHTEHGERTLVHLLLVHNVHDRTIDERSAVACGLSRGFALCLLCPAHCVLDGESR